MGSGARQEQEEIDKEVYYEEFSEALIGAYSKDEIQKTLARTKANKQIILKITLIVKFNVSRNCLSTIYDLKCKTKPN